MEKRVSLFCNTKGNRFLPMVAVLLAVPAVAETVIPCDGGTLAFERLAVEFRPGIVYCGWKGRATAVKTKAPRFAFTLEKPTAKVDGGWKRVRGTTASLRRHGPSRPTGTSTLRS